MNTFASFLFCFLPLIPVEILLPVLRGKKILLSAQIAVLAGFLAVIPVTIIQTLILHIPAFANPPDSFFRMLLFAFFINGLLEETGKFLFTALIPRKQTAAATVLALAVTTGTSFGCIENMIYLISNGRLFPARLITSVVIHAACTCIAAETLFPSEKKMHTVIPFMQAVLLHGLYNYFTVLQKPAGILAYICIAASVYRCFLGFTAASKKTQYKK